jgi:hypothetical protein
MNFVTVWSYDNYVPAHIAMGRLKDEGIECWLKDENTVTMYPIWTNALGGIKLMVAEPEAKKAWEILEGLRQEHKSEVTCPKCGSHNIEFVSTPRKASNWLSAFATFFLSDYALTVDKVHHCFDCGNEFPEEKPVE